MKDCPTLTEPWQVYLRVVGDFKVLASGTTICSEQQFCVVEFAIESQAWSRKAKQEPSDFIYKSIEADENGLVWVRRKLDKWSVGSIFQIAESRETFELAEITGALDNYYGRLRKAVLETFETDIAALFEWGRTQTRVRTN